MSARPIASICCCTPLNAPARALLEFVENREQRVHAFQALANLIVPAVAVCTEHEVLADAEA